MDPTTSITSAAITGVELNNIARVRFMDSESEEVAEWNTINRVNAVLLSSLSLIDVHIPQSSNALVELQ